MMSTDALIEFLTFTNDNLTAAIVITAASLLLYNLTRNIHDHVARAAAVLLGCVTIAYGVDSIASLNPELDALEAWYRIQWIGIAFIPAAMFHLAHALLSTTGRLSRGRRRLVVRALYAFSMLLMLWAAFTDLLITDLATDPVTYLRPGQLFPLYVAYFVVASLTALQFVLRARERCLTTTSRRRMSYMLGVMLTPGLGIFPYSLLFDSVGQQEGFSLLAILLAFNAANLLVIGMLVFMSYPLSFFGTYQSDRVVRRDLVQFLLRAPFITIIVLAMMVSVPRVSEPLGLAGTEVVIVAVVATLLALQWFTHLLTPYIDRWMIYTNDQNEALQLRELSERMITRADRRQIQESILATLCNQLRLPLAFMIRFVDGSPVLERIVGPDAPKQTSRQTIKKLIDALPTILQESNTTYSWNDYWLYTLMEEDSGLMLGVMGIWQPKHPLTPEEEDLLESLIFQAQQLLHDAFIYQRVVADLRLLADDGGNLRGNLFAPYQQLPSDTKSSATSISLPSEEHISKWVHGALRDFWGGPQLAENKLMQFEVVKGELEHHDGNPSRALQAILTRAIESLKPEGERSMTTTEWIRYNILELRFLEGKKVRDVANQLAMSQPDFYRKQRAAIQDVARYITVLESQSREEDASGQADES